MFLKSLTGEFPQIRLDAVSSNPAAKFGFQVNNELQLLDNLVILGDGTQDFAINGQIRDYYEPRAPNMVLPMHDVIKMGTSRVTLTGNNTFGGALSVLGGEVVVSGPSAALNGPSSILIGSEGKLTFNSGTISVPNLQIESGGSFDFSGGLLKTSNVQGTLLNNGGTFSPGASAAASRIEGHFIQLAGTLQIELGGISPGNEFDTLFVTGGALLDGTLQVLLLPGFQPGLGNAFQFLTAAGGRNGTFDNALLPGLTGGRTWNLLYGTNSVALYVGPAGGIGTVLPGDFNQDGTVDGADYTVWRDAIGQSSGVINVVPGTGADGSFDGQITAADYVVWRSMFGFSRTAGGFASFTAVPEPSTAALFAAEVMLVGAFVRRRRPRRPQSQVV